MQGTLSPCEGVETIIAKSILCQGACARLVIATLSLSASAQTASDHGVVGGKECGDYPRPRILEAQQRMNGCDACGRRITVDGSCGPQTERCLRQFQGSRFGREKGLDVTGTPNIKTVRALREYCER